MGCRGNGKGNEMKRDLDLQTKILQRLEEAGPDEEIRSLEGYSSEEFCYNAQQLHRAGLIDIMGFRSKTNHVNCIATGLTPAGHDRLDQARTEWRRRAKSVGGRAAQITFETVLRGMLEHVIR